MQIVHGPPLETETMTSSLRQSLLAIVSVAVVLTASSYAAAQPPLLVLDYNSAKVFGTVDIDGGAIDVTTGAMIVTTSSFGFVPEGYYIGSRQVLFPVEYGQLNVAEYGDAAIHDARLEGADYAAGGYWSGTNGIISSNAENGSRTAVGWIDNSVGAYTSYRGVPVNTSQSIIGYAYYGDALMSGSITALDNAVVGSSIGETIGLYGDFGNTINSQPEGVEWIDGDFDQDGAVDSSVDSSAGSRPICINRHFTMRGHSTQSLVRCSLPRSRQHYRCWPPLRFAYWATDSCHGPRGSHR